jgi:multicomponent Na+:H+ antiporter subunit D
MFDTLIQLPPFSLFFIGALLLLFCRGVVASAITIVVPILSFILLLQWQEGSYFHYSLMGMDLTLIRLDRLSLLFAYLFHLAALIAGIFALH